MSTNLRAALDIGSNTIRLLIAEVIGDTEFKRVHYQHTIARLGEGLQQSGKLSDAGMARAMAVFKEAVLICGDYGISARDIRAVATAAMREAANGQAFADSVRSETELNILIIDGELEASLALTGSKLGLSSEVGKDMLLFDIGGGSTEFNRVSQGDLLDSLSIKLGVVRLTELFLQIKQFSMQDYSNVKGAISEFLAQVEDSWGDSFVLPEHLVGTAGTVTTLAAIAQDMQVYDAELINGYSMSATKFHQVRDKLLSMNNEQRLAMPALEKGREDVIVAGLAIIDVLFERWKYDVLVSVDSGLLEGLLIVKPNP